MDSLSKDLVDDIFSHALKKQTGVSLKYMLDFGNNPIDRQLTLSAQFLHKELPVRLAHRVAELENLPYGLSSKKDIMKVCWACVHLCVCHEHPATTTCGVLVHCSPCIVLVEYITSRLLDPGSLGASLPNSCTRSLARPPKVP